MFSRIKTLKEAFQNFQTLIQRNYDADEARSISQIVFKEILGYKCYKATISINDGTKSIFYVTDAIAPLAVEANAKVKLTGFPLEMTVQTEQGEMIMKATKVSKEVSAEVFKVGDGFTKVTMEEFQKQMGG